MAFLKDARAEDVFETYAMNGVCLEDFPLEELSKNTEVICDGDTVFAIGGVDNDIVWLLCTHEVERQPVKFLRGIKTILKEKMRDKKVLRNYAWAENKLHLKWLKWMGAVFDGKEYVSEITGERFRYFEFNKGE